MGIPTSPGKFLPGNDGDAALVTGIRARDVAALESIITKYTREMFYFIRLLLDGVGASQDAEECCNDLFTIVWNDIESFDTTRGTLRTWMAMRAKYLALDRRRQLCRRQGANVYPAQEDGRTHPNGAEELAVDGLSSEANAIEEMIELGERRQELYRALATLPELDRYLIYFRYFKFASTEELASKTGLTKHAIDTRLWRTRRVLRELLKERLLV